MASEVAPYRSTEPMSKRPKITRKAGLKEGDIMRVKSTGALVRLVASDDKDDDRLVDDEGYVYVEPIEEISDWYNVSELERVR